MKSSNSKRAKIIACACHKGGVGKTTTTASVGGILSEKSRVLLVDLDPQMNLTVTFTDGESGESVFNAFADFKSRRNGKLPIVKVRKNLDLVPSSLEMCTVDADFASVPGRDIILKKLLEPFLGDYDWILIDLPAQLGAITVNALVAADGVIIPMSCDAYSADGLQQIANFVELVGDVNDRLRVIGILITRYNRRRVVDRMVAEKLREEWGDLVFDAVIRENAAISKAPLVKMDIATYDHNSLGALDYSALCKEIKKRA